VPQKTCFFICPLDENDSEIRTRSRQVLEKILRKALEPAFQIEHFLGVNRHQEIKDAIYDYIARSELCVVDLTGSNPNVLYEYGRRAALNRPAILLTANRKAIPFDLRTTSNIAYKLNSPEGAIQELKELVAQMEQERQFEPPVKSAISLEAQRVDQTEYICDYIARCRPRNIDVLQVSLMALGNKFFERIQECDVMLRILLIDPKYATKYSLKNYHAKDVERARDRIKIMRLETERQWLPARPTVGLWYYKHQPSVALLLMDESLSQLGWYLVAPRENVPLTNEELDLNILGHRAPGLIAEGADLKAHLPTLKRHFENVLRLAQNVERPFGPRAAEMEAAWQRLRDPGSPIPPEGGLHDRAHA